MRRPTRPTTTRAKPSRRLFGLALAVTIPLALVSCEDVGSMNPLATSADTLCDSSLRGSWVSAFAAPDSVYFEKLVLGPGTSPSWVVRNGHARMEYAVRMVQLGQRWFLDSRIESMDNPDLSAIPDSFMQEARKAHFIYRLDLVSDTLDLREFQATFVDDYETAHPGELSVMDSTSDDILLTNPTPELRRFVERVAQADSMFTPRQRFIRQR
jgi:hypothetical protein